MNEHERLEETLAFIHEKDLKEKTGDEDDDRQEFEAAGIEEVEDRLIELYRRKKRPLNENDVSKVL